MFISVDHFRSVTCIGYHIFLAPKNCFRSSACFCCPITFLGSLLPFQCVCVCVILRQPSALSACCWIIVPIFRIVHVTKWTCGQNSGLWFHNSFFLLLYTSGYFYATCSGLLLLCVLACKFSQLWCMRLSEKNSFMLFFSFAFPSHLCLVLSFGCTSVIITTSTATTNDIITIIVDLLVYIFLSSFCTFCLWFFRFLVFHARSLSKFWRFFFVPFIRPDSRAKYPPSLLNRLLITNRPTAIRSHFCPTGLSFECCNPPVDLPVCLFGSLTIVICLFSILNSFIPF